MSVFYINLQNATTGEIRQDGCLRATDATAAEVAAIQSITKSGVADWAFHSVTTRKARR